MNDSDNSTDVLQNTFILKNIENYYEKLDNSSEDIMNKYYELVIEFLNVITDHKMVSLKKKEIYKFILFRGLKTISHVFHMILFYSKNLELSYYHAVKSFYIYIEFIEQIMDDEHHFLNLYSRDSILFVYKKTIHDIPFQSIKQKQENETNLDIMNDTKKQTEKIEDFIFLLLNEEEEKIDKKFVFQVKDIFSKFTDKQYRKNTFTENKDIFFFFIENFFAESYFSQISFEKRTNQNKTEIICYLLDCFFIKISKMKAFDNSKKVKILEKKRKITDCNSPQEFIQRLFSTF